MSRTLLAVNAGSSSLKFAVFDAQTNALARGQIEGIGHAPRFNARVCADAANAADQALPATAGYDQALDAALDWISQRFPNMDFAAIGHRVVHGGPHYRDPIQLDAASLDALEALDPLAPLHQPYNLAAARRLRTRFPGVPQIASFDTAFHAGWDDAARRVALPRPLHDAGVRRYGFHGLSYEFVSGEIRSILPTARRVVCAHLGGGASVCAIRDGVSIDCTLGFSALDGLPMGTRCGSIDPAIVFHLHRQFQLPLDAIEYMLYHDSGLRGMSGISADMRELLASKQESAREAIAVFVHHCVRAIGAMAALLDGIDVLAFSGGIGEHAAPVRAAICARLGFLGIALDPAANAENRPELSAPGANARCLCIATDEESVIARHCAAWISP